ncbi:hypothetical protein C1646_763888 [Rhizophagus diaphanus]|nr:hypothetical protein C1646_763888 [Rhizophagus diaphanus] [Rhizophagus sp. MUCL 43196]
MFDILKELEMAALYGTNCLYVNVSKQIEGLLEQFSAIRHCLRKRSPLNLGHLEESVKNKFHESDFDLVMISGRLTSICQPLDVAIKKPFKDNLCKEWHLWMANGSVGETAAGNL